MGLPFTASLAAILLVGCASGPRPFRGTTVVWRDDDRHPFQPRPEPRFVAEAWDAVDNLVMRPAARALAFDTSGESIDVNALDEVPDSSWFENRIGLTDLEPAEVAAGACGLDFEDPLPPWRVVGGKLNGATAGFVFEDARGRRFVFKADRDLQPEQATGADAIVAALYHAVGYQVSCNRVVALDAEWLVLDPDAEIGSGGQGERPMTEEDLAEVIARLRPGEDGRLRGAVSLYLDGAPLGPWDYRGTWEPDLNDVIDHEDRRELRGMRVLNAWIDHWDARQVNTLAIWHPDGETGAGHVEHHVIDFGDTLGFVQGSHRAQIRYGHSQWLDTQHVIEDLFTFGLVERPWDAAERGPTWPILGYLDVERFDPDEWRPNYWNGAFERCTERDAAWMARIIARFDEPRLSALIALGRFTDPAVEPRLRAVLMGRRERVLERYLTRVSPLAGASIDADELCLEDVAVRSGIRRAEDRRHAAWALDENGAVLASLGVRPEGARICVQLDAVRSRYAIVRVQSGTDGVDAPQPLDVHVVSESGRRRVAGLDRRTDGRLPWPG